MNLQEKKKIINQVDHIRNFLNTLENWVNEIHALENDNDLVNQEKIIWHYEAIKDSVEKNSIAWTYHQIYSNIQTSWEELESVDSSSACFERAIYQLRKACAIQLALIEKIHY